MKIDIDSISLRPSDSLKDALKNLKNSGLRIVLITDSKTRLLGLLTDGDIRNAILEGASMETRLSDVMNDSPIVLPEESSPEKILMAMSNRDLYHIPLVNKDGLVVDVKTRPKKDVVKLENTVVIMAGGEGIRMRPLTENTPKPLLEINGKPILELILNRFMSQGFYNFVISVNYKKEMIMNYFGDGSKLGISISYIQETKPMGTAGSLALLKEFTAPIIVMNADILTNTDFTKILQHHYEQDNSLMTMVVRPHEYKISYGVVNHREGKVQGIEEKPVKTYYFNAGIYILSAPILENIPEDYFDMTMLVESSIKKNIISTIYILNDYWMDIGQMNDYERAQNDFELIFKD